MAPMQPAPRGVRWIGGPRPAPLLGAHYRGDASGGWRFSFRTKNGAMVQGHTGEAGESQDPAVADAGGMLGWTDRIRLAHYKIGLIMELVAVVCRLSRRKHSSENDLQLSCLDLLKGLCRAVLEDYMRMASVEVRREKPTSSKSYDMYILASDGTGLPVNDGLHTIVELKLNQSDVSYANYIQAHMLKRVASTGIPGKVGDSYLLNVLASKTSNNLVPIHWDRFVSCVPWRTTCSEVAHHPMRDNWGESSATIDRLGQLVLQLVPADCTNTPDEILRGRGYTAARDLCLQNLWSPIKTALNPDEPLEASVVEALRLAGVPLDPPDSPRDPSAGGAKKRGRPERGDADWGDTPTHMDAEPASVDLGGVQVSLRVPIDRRLGRDVVEEVLGEHIEVNCEFSGDGSELKASNWTAACQRMDFGGNACIAKIGRLATRDARGGQLREEYWAQIRPYGAEAGAPDFNKEFFPRLPVARILWCALTFPEGNRWQRLVEEFRGSVVHGSVVPSGDGGDGGVVRFKRNVAHLRDRARRGALVDDQESGAAWKQLGFPQSPRASMVFDQSAPAYLLGELLASGREHVRGHGWRFPSLPVGSRPWGDEALGVAKLQDVIRYMDNDEMIDAGSSVPQLAERIEELCHEEGGKWKSAIDDMKKLCDRIPRLRSNGFTLGEMIAKFGDAYDEDAEELRRRLDASSAESAQLRVKLEAAQRELAAVARRASEDVRKIREGGEKIQHAAQMMGGSLEVIGKRFRSETALSVMRLESFQAIREALRKGDCEANLETIGDALLDIVVASNHMATGREGVPATPDSDGGGDAVRSVHSVHGSDSDGDAGPRRGDVHSVHDSDGDGDAGPRRGDVHSVHDSDSDAGPRRGEVKSIHGSNSDARRVPAAAARHDSDSDTASD